MWFSRKQVVKADPAKAGAAEYLPPAMAGQGKTPTGAAGAAGAGSGQITTKRRGDAAEAQALAFLLKAGLKAEERNYRTPGRGGGEIDLVMRAPDGTLVFVEVRQRTASSHGGAGASIGIIKQRRIVLAARNYLMRFNSPPPCRFDVVLVQGCAADYAHPDGRFSIEWVQAAFDAT